MSNQNIEFKDSQIHWIGHIPKHWEIKKVKDGFYLKKDKALIENPVVLTLARSGIKVRDLENNEGQFAKSYLEYNLVEIDDLLLNTMDLQSGDNCNISRIQGVISPAYANLRYKNGFSPNFYNYYFKIQYWTFAFFTHGKGVSYENRWTLNNQTLMRFPLLVPPLNEQKEIAEFLDKKCASIDSSIENLEQKIKSLAEYKKALITQCVTKGLNPKILEFKDSEIPWIRQIPKHWEISKIKYVAKIRSENSSFNAENDKYIGLENVAGYLNSLIETNTEYENSIQAVCKKGDILFSKLRPYLSKVIIAPFNCFCSSEFLQFINLKCYFKFFYYFLLNKNFIENVNSSTYGAKMPRANSNYIMNLNFLVPPLNEQKEIAEFLDKKCEKIDNLSANYKQQIKTLKEYKKALIYECVTGKKQI